MAPITRLDIEHYRSIRRLSLDLDRLTVVTGPNGAGKSNLYRALELLQAAADGGLSRRLATEGGVKSALWAGDRQKGPVRLRLGVEFESLSYELAVGPPRFTDAALPMDLVVKEETVAARHGGRTVTMLKRKGPQLSARDPDGRMASASHDVWLFQTALSSLVEPTLYPELAALRRRLLDARFYHQFRVDRDSPLRRPHPLIASPSVDSDGANWAAALYSRLHIADGWRDVDRSPAAIAIARAFNGARPAFFTSETEIEAGLGTREFQREFRARELSDGSLRFLALTAALTALRPPSVIVLNEPEASLHDELIDPLADLIAAAAESSQIIVVTHAPRLAERLDVEHGAQRVALFRENGETRVA